ncbi:DNA N-6-adenine-methyltransferase [Hafnia phage Pocis76]|uniref:DNA N-6-adenine-methyltransferase n=1 Tax=Hafnia phage Pocis76 TaxID=2831174 RepID=A0A8E7FMY2_9CAUD|nr:DNA N-6-adenine-methyltransferase [Hafnia phage Pocis76]
MKDVHDSETMTFDELFHADCLINTLAFGGHYQPVAFNSYFKVSGNRYAGSKTPDVVRDLWSTPREVVAWMISEYGSYDLDAAASENNKVCENFFSESDNCLVKEWGENQHIWLNPPYSKPDPFVRKAIEQMEHGNQIDMLLPADNSTAWFSDAQKSAAEIIWITGDTWTESGVEYSRTGRLAFTSALTGEPVSGNNKGSAIFVMRKLKDGESQKTRYVPITEICPSVKNKRARARRV